MFLPSLVSTLPLFARPKPANPTAGAPAASSRPATPLFGMFAAAPGARLGTASAPLASPSIGTALTPQTAALAAIAGTLARRTFTKTQGTP